MAPTPIITNSCDRMKAKNKGTLDHFIFSKLHCLPCARSRDLLVDGTGGPPGPLNKKCFAPPLKRGANPALSAGCAPRTRAYPHVEQMRAPQGRGPGQTAKFSLLLAVWTCAGSPRWQGACAAGGGHTANPAKGHGAPPVLAVWPWGAGRSPIGGAGKAPPGPASPPNGPWTGPQCPFQRPVVPFLLHAWSPRRAWPGHPPIPARI
jgi:hypothetical protein